MNPTVLRGFKKEAASLWKGSTKINEGGSCRWIKEWSIFFGGVQEVLSQIDWLSHTFRNDIAG